MVFILLLLLTTPALCDPAKDLFSAIQNGRDDLVAVELELLTKDLGNLETVVNSRDPGSGQTPLMMSVLRGREEVVRLLLAVPQVDATIPEKEGYTPFHGAGFQGRAEIARLLLKDSRQLDPEDKHSDGFQPLHRACWGQEPRHAETVAVLVEEGGVPWDSRAKGKTCMEITHNAKTKAWLKKWASKQNKEL